MTNTEYIVQTASAKMPSSCRGTYARVAVIEVDAGVKRVSMISPRAKGVVRIVATWERRSVGKTKNCAFQRALRAAEMMVDELKTERRQREERARKRAYKKLLRTPGADLSDPACVNSTVSLGALARMQTAFQDQVGTR